MTDVIDCAVIGAGVVGLAIGRDLARAGREVVVLDRADRIGYETSSRNSEVIHAGIYYVPDSLKARLCRVGKDLLYDFCTHHGVPYRRVGKVIVATSDQQRASLAGIHHNAIASGVYDLEELSADDVSRLEPAVQGVAGLFSPSTGIIDSHQYMLALQGDLESAGGVVALRSPVIGAAVVGSAVTSAGLKLDIGGDDRQSLLCRTVINAAGLWAHDVARLFGIRPLPPQYFAIGHYYTLAGRAPFQHLVYPMPEDGGLGVHVTLDMAGQARFGPDVRWINGVDYRFDDSRRADFISAIRSYYPDLDEHRLHIGYTGIRPKIIGPDQGFSDFRIDDVRVHGTPGLINLFGIESPGLTSSLALASMVKDKVQSCGLKSG